MLGGYKGFKEDFELAKLDEMWVTHDVDSNGLLDKAEAIKFIAEIKENVADDRSGNYSEDKFETVFTKFDENKDGYLEKAEMAVLIKKVFAAAKWIPSGKLEFRYFAIYGRGSPGRAMLSHAGKQFEDIGENPPTWPNNKPTAPYNGGSLPIVVLPDGKVLR